MSVEVTVLPNGLSVVTQSMQHLESAALSVWVKAGSRNEDDNSHGVAHFLEHMAFKGTDRRTAGGIADEIESVGGDLNAGTSIETTSYYARVLRDDVELGLDILSDILLNSKFDAEEVAREQHVILQEIGASHDNPDDVVFENFMETAFGGQPLGRPILGTAQTVSGFSRDDMLQYLQQHYRGPQMVVACAGAVEHEQFVAMVRARFSEVTPEIDEPPVPAVYTGGESIVLKDTQEAHVLIGFPGRAYHVRDYYASQLLAQIMGGGMSSRLFQEIREKHGLCYSIYAFHWSFSDTGVFGIHAATGPEDNGELVRLIVQELRRAADDISQHEIDRARAQVRASLMMSMESPASRAGQIARQVLLFGRPVTNEELMDRLNALTPERLRDLAHRTFRSPEITLAALGPVQEMPSRAELISALSADDSSLEAAQ
ncbi:MAG: pitrilysin family protein [Pseudomonadota bacterium]